MPRMVWRGTDGPESSVALAFLLDTLTRWNVFLMGRYRLPPLYEAGVRYIQEDYTSEHPEDWLDCLEVLKQGGGDCEDLACYRAAELRAAGESEARAVFHRRRRQDGGTLVHILVARANGQLEDPSRILGMRG